MTKKLLVLCFLCCALHCISAMLFLEGGNLGKIHENAQKEYSLNIKNVSEESLILENISSSCACVSIVDWEPYTKLEAGAGITLKIRLDASRLPLGNFAKSIFVSVRGSKKPVPLIVSGTVFALFKIEPNSRLKLNGCTELSQWKQRVSIQPIEKLSPETMPVLRNQPQKLAVSLQKGQNGEFWLEVTPRLPLPTGILKENLELIFPEEKCAKISVEAIVAKPVFQLEKQQVELTEAEQQASIRLTIASQKRTRHGTKALPVDYQAALTKLAAQVPQGLEAVFTAQKEAILLTIRCKSVPAKNSAITIRYGKDSVGNIACNASL